VILGRVQASYIFRVKFTQFLLGIPPGEEFNNVILVSSAFIFCLCYYFLLFFVKKHAYVCNFDSRTYIHGLHMSYTFVYKLWLQIKHLS
jgi:hypothetical protein